MEIFGEFGSLSQIQNYIENITCSDIIPNQQTNQANISLNINQSEKDIDDQLINALNEVEKSINTGQKINAHLRKNDEQSKESMDNDLINVANEVEKTISTSFNNLNIFSEDDCLNIVAVNFENKILNIKINSDKIGDVRYFNNNKNNNLKRKCPNFAYNISKKSKYDNQCGGTIYNKIKQRQVVSKKFNCVETITDIKINIPSGKTFLEINDDVYNISINLR